MLVLVRKDMEEIVIGDSIRIVVVRIEGDKVRLGIDAPSFIPVHRREVYDAITRETGESPGCIKAGMLPVVMPREVVEFLSAKSIDVAEFKVLKEACRDALRELA